MTASYLTLEIKGIKFICFQKPSNPQSPDNWLKNCMPTNQTARKLALYTCLCINCHNMKIERPTEN